MIYKGMSYMKKNFTTILKWALAIVLVGIAIYFLKHSKVIENIGNLNGFIYYIRSQGKYAYIVFMVIFALKPLVLIIPSNLLSISSGIVFGPFLGTILTSMGFFVSGSLAFFIARILGQDAVNKILRGKALNLNNRLEQDGFKVLVLLRLIPILPYDPVSYAAGLSKVKYRDFIISSVIGVLPEVICYSIIGENAMNPLSPKFFIPLSVIVLITIISGIIVKKDKANEHK